MGLWQNDYAYIVINIIVFCDLANTVTKKETTPRWNKVKITAIIYENKILKVTRKPTRLKGWENYTSTRSPNLTLVSCNLDLVLLDLKLDHDIALPHGSLVPISSKIGSLPFKTLVSEVLRVWDLKTPAVFQQDLPHMALQMHLLPAICDDSKTWC